MASDNSPVKGLILLYYGLIDTSCSWCTYFVTTFGFHMKSLLQVMDYLKLPVIVWLPTEQYSGLISKECPKCGMEGIVSQLSPTDWTDGRLLNCASSNVILVSRVYHCPNQHCVLAHHPDIIHRFTRHNLQTLLPF